jgi:TPP-dependent pyruvate/acetoin dehydrogenase alpha subunit
LDGDTTHFANQPVNLAGLSKEDRHDVERKLGAVMTTSLAQALGAAMLNKTRKNGKIALVWGGAPENDPWLDVLEAARAHTLPVIFVADADRPNRARKSGRRRHTVLKPGKQLPAITVDGNDVVALYRVAHEAIDRARRGRGPTLIELATYRLGRRTFANAVADMENYLRGRGLLRLGMRRELMAGIETMLAREVTIE